MYVRHLLKKTIRPIAFTVVVLLGGCDAADCIIDRHPQFSSDSLPVATVNQEYEAALQVDIHSSNQDDEYSYSVRLEGRLPPGLSLQTSGRDVFFTGTPTELGDFSFTLNLYAEPRDSGYGFNFDDQASDLCDDEISQEFVISVEQGF